jgi:hypothetical protein
MMWFQSFFSKPTKKLSQPFHLSGSEFVSHEITSKNMKVGSPSRRLQVGWRTALVPPARSGWTRFKLAFQASKASVLSHYTTIPADYPPKWCSGFRFLSFTLNEFGNFSHFARDSNDTSTGP